MSQTVATRSILEVASLSKTFPGQVALDDASLMVRPGQVHTLVGQNGSGKSTLIKVLAGYHDPDPGSHVQVLGRDLFAEHETDLRRRIHVMHQDLGLVGSLNAVENLALGRGFHTGRFGRVRWKVETARAQVLLHEFGATFDPRLPVASLTAAEQAILALARAMQDWDGDGGLLVLDEPTASFSRDDVDRLFGAVRRVATRGAGVIFVSHRLDEVFEISDQVTVLRDGRVVACRPTSDLDHDTLIELIVGRAVDEMYPTPPPTGTDVVLEVRGLWGDIVEQVDLVVHSGEIVGIAGLDGSGREELAGLLFGARHRSHGQVIVEGEALAASPRSAMEHGVALVPADRKRMGSIGNQSVRQNITIAQLGPLFRAGRLSRRLEQREARRWIDEVEVRPDDPDARLRDVERRQPAEGGAGPLVADQAEAAAARRADAGRRRRREGDDLRPAGRRRRERNGHRRLLLRGRRAGQDLRPRARPAPRASRCRAQGQRAGDRDRAAARPPMTTAQQRPST